MNELYRSVAHIQSVFHGRQLFQAGSSPFPDDFSSAYPKPACGNVGQRTEECMTLCEAAIPLTG
jgi:hypothetical protein